MKIILLSGGSGQRLWPLSNQTRSKQFLKVLKKIDGQYESMVQRVWRQLSRVGLSESALIATSVEQVSMIRSQIGEDVPIITEPSRKDTFPAIALASLYLYSIYNVDPNEIIAVLPVDPYVEDSFFSHIRSLDDVLNQSGADIALMGVQPTYPSAKYGYIIPTEFNHLSQKYFTVKRFCEKPTEEQAVELIRQKALWNCGVFAFRLGFMISLLDQKGFPIQYDQMFEQFSTLPKISFDYEVLEKTNNIMVIPYSGSWKDLGTWNTLTEEMTDPLVGKGEISLDSTNTHVINELGIPVAVLGLQDIVVAASPDGILVTDKKASPRIKELLHEYDHRPMYEERHWGWYRVLDYTKFGQNVEVLTKRICVKAGKNISYQIHYKRSEIWTIIAGTGEFALDNTIYEVKAGDVLQIPVGSKHAIKAHADLEIIEVQRGSELVEEDIERICLRWEEVERICMGMGVN